MRFTTCGVCRNEKIPVNASLLVDGVVYCENCMKERFPNDADLRGKNLVKEFDPTICVNCSKDSGDAPFKMLAGYPMCNACEQAVQLKIFPTWVKAFFAGVVLLVAFSLVWNWRFVEAYYQMKKTAAVLESRNLEDAAQLYSAMATNVPEVPELQQLADYYSGVVLLSQDKGAEALTVLRGCTALPDNYDVPILTLQAEIAASFDNKDYLAFVDASRRYLSFDTSSIAMAQVASAYACLYADQKSDSARILALQYLEKPIVAQDTTQFLTEYVNRIKHRLATGEIIDRKTFEARFPSGWTK